MSQQFNKRWSFKGKPLVLFDEDAIIDHPILHPQEGLRFFMLCDENTYLHCFPLLSEKLKEVSEVLVLPAGEIAKTLQYAQQIWQWLFEHNASRSDYLIALGGGVISDIANYAGGTYKRGMHLINIPTSLMAQVDASIGGKAAINFGGLKNSIGIFCVPEAVLIFPSFLRTLDSVHIKNGLAEVLKYGFIHEPALLDLLKEYRSENIVLKIDERILSLSIQSKIEFITSDPNDRGLRKALNFGHSIGHALESLAAGGLLHGEAVAIGMYIESKIAEKSCGLSQKEGKLIRDNISQLFRMPSSLPDGQDLWNLMKNDKKNDSVDVMLALPSGLGKCEINVSLSKSEFQDCMHSYPF